MTYYDEYDEADYDDYDPAGEEDEYEFSDYIKNFILDYSKEPLHIETLPHIKKAYKRLTVFSSFFEDIQKVFVNDVLAKMKSSKLQRKFITEVFLYQFKGLHLQKNPQDFLKVLYQENTKTFATLANKYGNYQYIIQFINTVMNHIEKKPKTFQYTPSVKSEREKKEEAQEREDWYGNSDAYYWEAVHDGDITPSDFLESSADHSDSFDDYYEDRFDAKEEAKKYSDPQRIASNLETYIKQLEEGAASKIDLESQRTFLKKFERFSYSAKSILEKIDLQEHIVLIFPKLEQIAIENQLKVMISRSYDYSIEFYRENGKKFIDLTFIHTVNNKDDWSGNELSFYNEYVEKTTTEKDLDIVLEVMNTAGYDVGKEYKNYVRKAFKSKGFETVIYELPSKLKIEMINHGSHLRQFLRWKDI